MHCPDNENTKDQQFFFLGQQWIKTSIIEYRQSNQTISRLLRIRVQFPEKFFAAALLHIYLGTFSLEDITDLVLVTQEELTSQRTQIDFLILVDRLKVQFTRHFREKLTSNVYTPADYGAIAAEFAAFDEMTRNQIRVPLYIEMRELAGSIARKSEFDLPIDRSIFRSFQKLFSFFVFEPNFMPVGGKPLSREFSHIAEEIVWQRLGEDFAALASQLEVEPEHYPIKPTIKRLFADLYPQ